MGKISNELENLENGEIPESMDYSLDNYIQKKFTNHITYKTFTPEFVANYFSETLLYMFPQLKEVASKEYEENKHRTPLQEMMDREKEALKIKKSQSILYDC